jgi:hypothetical protein
LPLRCTRPMVNSPGTIPAETLEGRRQILDLIACAESGPRGSTRRVMSSSTGVKNSQTRASYVERH